MTSLMAVHEPVVVQEGLLNWSMYIATSAPLRAVPALSPSACLNPDHVTCLEPRELLSWACRANGAHSTSQESVHAPWLGLASPKRPLRKVHHTQAGGETSSAVASLTGATSVVAEFVRAVDCSLLLLLLASSGFPPGK